MEPALAQQGKIKIGLMLPYTGTYAALGTAITNGFKLAIDNAPPPGATAAPAPTAEPILHSTRFVLVDGQGRIRGYYEAFDEESMKKLERDLKALGY